jgi:two-component system, LuxR family, response regulator FixJ
MKAGAAIVLARPYGDEVLLGAVRSALAADTQAATRTAHRTTLAALTPREHDVLGGLLDGKANKMIARHLGISPRTVEAHRASVMRKSGVGSIAELVRLAVSAQRLH